MSTLEGGVTRRKGDAGGSIAPPRYLKRRILLIYLLHGLSISRMTAEFNRLRENFSMRARFISLNNIIGVHTY